MILSTNQRLIKVGQDYSAGENIGIYEHTISSRNWSPDITYAAESAFQRANGYTDTQISALSGEVSSEVSQLGSDIQYISGVALTSHQSLEGYLTKASGDEYYQPIGSYATVSQLESTSGEIVNLIPTDYVSNETLEQTSGNIVNLIPDTSEFITNASAEQTYQPIGNYLSSNALEGYATQTWVQDQGYLTGVSIPESATWQDVSTTVQTNSAQWAEGGSGGDEEVNSFVYNNSATINDVNSSYKTYSSTFLTALPSDLATTGDLDSLSTSIAETYYPYTNPSSFVNEDWVTAQGYITGVDLSEYAKRDFVLSSIESATSGKLDVSSFASVSSDFLVAESLNGYATESFVENVSGEITALIPDTSNFITNSSAEETYQTIAGMTAYQPVGDYATTADLALKQDALTFGYDEQDRISAINNSAVAGGTDLEFGYDSADNISAINNSAISQTPSQKLYAQSPLTTGVSGTSAYIGIEPSARYNETVLLDRGTDDLTMPNTAQLSEPFSAFEKIEMWCVWNPWPTNVPQATYYPGDASAGAYMVFDNSQYMRAGYGLWRVTGTTIQLISASQTENWPTFQGTSNGLGGIRKIVGINRKENA